MPKALDLTNKIFGNLKVIQKAPSKSGKTYWTCECLLCGNIKEIQTSHLTSGASQSCGCQKKVFGESKISKTCILCGQKFIANTPNRQYCYECSPKGLSAADALRYKKRKLKDILIQYKGGKCQECGYNKCKGALQFHHRDPKEKEFCLANINLNDNNFTLKRLFEEVDKCDLLCANCHAEKHYKKN